MMTAEQASGDDLDHLLAAYLDDALDARDTARLHERLRHDDEARRLLLAAATQASALPRLGLEAALPRRMPAARRQRWWLPAAAAAAALVIGTLAWWSSLAGTVRVTGGSVTVERAGVRQPTETVQAADHLVTGDAPAVIAWPAQDTRIDLASDTRVRVDALGDQTRLHLEHGGLQAVVAPQPAGNVFAVATPHGRIEVVGTRFDVQVQDDSTRVAVTHGRVRVWSHATTVPVDLEAGYATDITAATVSAPGPLTTLPAAQANRSASPTAAGVQTRLTARDFIGGEGEVVGDRVRAIAVDAGRVVRLTTPLRRPGGWARLHDTTGCTLRVHVDRATTVALLLVCDRPAGGGWWVGNLQAERQLAAGTHDLTITRDDLRAVASAAVPSGSRVVAAAVMSWSPAADLRLEWLDFTH